MIILVNGFKLFSYYPPLDLTDLSEQNMKINQYVKGTITDCVTVHALDSRRASGNSGTFLKGVEEYYYYTIPISDDQYIRVLINDEESIKGMEQIVNGDAAEVSFTGQIAIGEPLNTVWYNWDPEFDQSKVVVDYMIWQKELDTEKNLCRKGFWGILIAALIYCFGGGIQIVDVTRKLPKPGKPVSNYNKENELAIARRNLEMYREQEIVYRKKTIPGTICLIMGIPIVMLNLSVLKPAGLLLIFYGVKKWWDYFINSRNEFAFQISSFLSKKTLQTKIAREESKIKELEQDSFTDV